MAAIDPDSPINANVRYSITDETHFRIDEVTGQIMVSRALDRETVPSYSFKVVATDSSPFLPLTSTADVTITVTDVNDHRPAVTNRNRDFFVPPNLSRGAFVMGVSAGLATNSTLFCFLNM